eukprot:TRINITY_DN4905_c0_g1_i5.p1 TRINITY_DN4905_c0_g1~~TRINITY_DN4905_c0_g1_i5.p1  ORF type:complete len:197 (+),score=31.39 TRINITY_DN4905_c0_g1_i5:70-660(+)
MGQYNTKLTNEDECVIRSTEVETGIDRRKLLKQYRAFKKKYPSGEITRDDFEELAQSFLPQQQRTEDFIYRLFNAFDADRSGAIDFHEFMLAVTLRSSVSEEEKLRFCFRSLDLNNDGVLDRSEMLYAVKLLFLHNPGLEDQVDTEVNTPTKLLDKIFQKADTNGDGELTIEELVHFLQTDPQTFKFLGLSQIFLT